MLFRLIIHAFAVLVLPLTALAQSAENAQAGLQLELNTVQDVSGNCRLTFLVENKTGTAIDKAVFEAVVFDRSGSVVGLSLFNFRDLPAERPRVRQFELSNTNCNTIGKALINGANSCIVEGSEAEICDKALSLRSRIDVELLG